MEEQELIKLIRDYRRINNQAKNYEQDAGILRRKLLDEMESRDLHELRVGKYRVFVTEYYTLRVDTEKLRKEQSALCERYTLCIPSKRLTVS